MRQPDGVVSLYEIDEITGLIVPGSLRRQHNQIQFKWALLASKLFGAGDASYRVSAMYLEFANVVTPGDTVSPPSYDRSEQIEYYQGLSGNRDYLRIGLRGQPVLEIAPGYENYFDAGEGNRLTWSAQSAGTAGVRGLPFASANNSLVIGVALVAARNWIDPSRDIIMGRAYYAPAAQIPKSASRQVGVSWEQTFPVIEG